MLTIIKLIFLFAASLIVGVFGFHNGTELLSDADTMMNIGGVLVLISTVFTFAGFGFIAGEVVGDAIEASKRTGGKDEGE